MVLILSQINPVRNTPFYFSNIYFNSILPPTCRSSGALYPFEYPTKIFYAFLLFLMCATFPGHLITPYSIFLITFGDECKLRSSSLCSFHQPLIILFHFCPKILPSTLFPYTLYLCSSLNVRDQALHPH
jgi:hypothetical protein